MTGDSTLKSPGLQQKLLKLQERLGPEPAWGLKDRHKLGLAIQDAVRKESALGDSRYGAGTVNRIAEVLGLKRSILDKLRCFAEAFDQEQVEQFAGARLPGGEALSWSHVRALLAVQDEKKRARLLERTKAEGWTSARLEAAIRDLKGGKARGGGRRPLAPATLEDLVLQMGQLLDGWENRHEQVWSKQEHSLAALVRRLPARKVNQKTVGMLSALRECWEKAATRSRAMADELDLVISALRGKVGKG